MRAIWLQWNPLHQEKKGDSEVYNYRRLDFQAYEL